MPDYRNNAFDLAWQNAPEPDRAPIAAAHYRLCRQGASDCTSGKPAAAEINRLDDLQVPGSGESGAAALAPGRRRQPPARQGVHAGCRCAMTRAASVAFDPTAPADPTALTASVSDAVSGVATGTIELSGHGSGIWQRLPTTLDHGKLVTRVDDAALPAGVYPESQWPAWPTYVTATLG